MKIHMVSKGGLSKLHVCPHRGEGGGQKKPKNPSTWFMDVPLPIAEPSEINSPGKPFL